MKVSKGKIFYEIGIKHFRCGILSQRNCCYKFFVSFNSGKEEILRHLVSDICYNKNDRNFSKPINNTKSQLKIALQPLKIKSITAFGEFYIPRETVTKIADRGFSSRSENVFRFNVHFDTVFSMCLSRRTECLSDHCLLPLNHHSNQVSSKLQHEQLSEKTKALKGKKMIVLNGHNFV